MRRKTKKQIKADETFMRVLNDLFDFLGATRGYCYPKKLSTCIGDLDISIYSDWVAGRFWEKEVIEKAKEIYTYYPKHGQGSDLNGYTGKFNFLYFDRNENILAVIEHLHSKLVPILSAEQHNKFIQFMGELREEKRK